MIAVLVLLVALLAPACLTLGVVVWRLRRALSSQRVRLVAVQAELHRVEGQAARLETVRRDFVANISHELRTPLASIKLLVETLEAGALDDRDVALNFTRKIGDETDYLIGMARELLDLARLEATPQMHPRAVEPAQMVLQAVERMRPLARTREVALRADLPRLLPLVWADAEQVGRVFVNLLNNAITFTPPGGSVVVGVRVEGHMLHCSVSDTGPGIPQGEETRIFERFYKADAARQRGGTGLGLSIARHIVEAQGGRIWACNREDSGACFTFTLPVAGAVAGVGAGAGAGAGAPEARAER